jgi:hypothetical protein
MSISQSSPIVPFDNLPTSTITGIVYSNIKVELSPFFNQTNLLFVNPPLTKKKKNINKKELYAPYGRIIGLQYGVYIRGVRTSKKKKYWCPNCQKVEIKNEKEEKILTVDEESRVLTSEECLLEDKPEGTVKIHFICHDCKDEFQIKQLQKIVPFLNQVTIVLSLDEIMVNVMMFKDNFKIAGNKTMNHAYETIMILWENYITKIGTWSFSPPKKGEEPHKDAHFLFDLVMQNVDFNLNFPIDKPKLNILMNAPEYKDRIRLSQCETTAATHVNIKMYAEKPENFKYDVLVYPEGRASKPRFIKVDEKLYAKKKKAKPSYITFIVFSSSEIILTGRYHDSMKDRYEFFVKTAQKNRGKIEEVIQKPKMSIRDYLESVKNTTTV